MGSKIYFLGGYHFSWFEPISIVESFDLEKETWEVEYTGADPLLRAFAKVGKIVVFKEKVLVGKQEA